MKTCERLVVLSLESKGFELTRIEGSRYSVTDGLKPYYGIEIDIDGEWKSSETIAVYYNAPSIEVRSKRLWYTLWLGRKSVIKHKPYSERVFSGFDSKGVTRYLMELMDYDQDYIEDCIKGLGNGIILRTR